jgi:mRNA interferase MazF
MRWAVVWVRLDPVEGHEQAGQRPALVVSFEPFHSAGLLTILPITSARTEPRYPGDVPIPAGTAGLRTGGVVICQPRTISVSRVMLPVAPHRGLRHIEDAVVRQAVRDALAHHVALDVRPARDGAAGIATYRD